MLVNKETAEAIITFVQDQPGFNPENSKWDINGRSEVATIIIPFDLAEKLHDVLKDCLEKEKSADSKE